MADYYAFSGIDDAIEKTKSLLWPFNWSIWWRIAVISLFTGYFGGINFPFSPSSYSQPFDSSQAFTGMPGLPGIILLLIAAVLLIAVVFAFLSSIFQFVFVRCLSENEFMLKKYFVENIGRGLRLFAFWIILILAAIVSVLALFFFALAAGGALSVLMIIPAIGIFLLILLLVAIIALFTSDFVVPIMIKDNCGVIEGWKKCWGVLRASFSQSLVYLVMRVIISIIVAIILVIISVVVLLLIGIPFLAFFILSGAVFGLSLLKITLLILFLVIAIPVLLIICVPFNTFLRVYSLKVLGKMEERYNLIE